MRKTKLRFLNSEWYRNPVSELEYSLRVPHFINGFTFLALKRLGLKALLFTIAISLSAGQLFESRILNLIAVFLISLLLSLIWEFFVVRNWYDDYALPRHLKVVEKIKQESRKGFGKSSPELVRTIEKLTAEYAVGIEALVYVGLYTFLIEIIIKNLYRIISSGENYRDIFVGFENKNVESDILLWKYANEKSHDKKKKLLEKYVEEYGSRVEDVDMAIPTLRERNGAIESLAAIYSQLSNSPEDMLEEAVKRRKKEEKKVRMPFGHFVKFSQRYATLREDRRFYEFLAEYDLRQMILLLGKRLNLEKSEDIFALSWKEVKERARG